MSAISPLRQDAPSRQELQRCWEGALSDPALRQLPYRIEINKWGHLEMTPPASPRHMSIATRIAMLLRERLGGEAFTECALITSDGVRVADVVWCSPDFLSRYRDEWVQWAAAFAQAPELCVEVVSPSNTYAELRERIQLYLDAGAAEAWLVHPNGKVELFGREGAREDSELAAAWADWPQVVERLAGP